MTDLVLHAVQGYPLDVSPNNGSILLLNPFLGSIFWRLWINLRHIVSHIKMLTLFSQKLWFQHIWPILEQEVRSQEVLAAVLEPVLFLVKGWIRQSCFFLNLNRIWAGFLNVLTDLQLHSEQFGQKLNQIRSQNRLTRLINPQGVHARRVPRPHPARPPPRLQQSRKEHTGKYQYRPSRLQWLC